MGGGGILREGVEFGGRLLATEARFEACDYGEPMVFPGGAICGFRRNLIGELIDVAKRNPELRIENQIEPMKRRRRDANDGIRVTREQKCFADDILIGIEAPAPDAIADDDHWLVVFLACKASAKGHGELRDVKVICRGELAPHSVWFALTTDGRGNKFVIAGDTGEGMDGVANVFEDRTGEMVTTHRTF